MFENMSPEVAAVIANTPALQDFYAAERLKAEAAAQDALNEQQRIAQKQEELDELRRKNDLEEQRNAELARQGSRIEQLFALTTGIMDAYIAKHHDPLYNIMQIVQHQVGMILQAQGYVVPELLQLLGNDPRLLDLSRRIAEEVQQQIARTPAKSSTVIYAGDTPTTLNAPGANIHRMNITGD